MLVRPKGMKTTLCLSALLTFGVFPSAYAQRDYRHHSEPRVIVYEDSNFRGGSLTLYPGDRIDDLEDARFDNGKKLNDQISSVRVVGGAAIMLFDDYNMQGYILRTASPIRNLADRDQPGAQHVWNDRISSLRVMGQRHGGGGNYRPNPKPEVNPNSMIRKAYQEVLSRSADPDGLSYYRGLVIDQGWTDRMVRRHMMESDEYRHEVVDKMIHDAYQDVLKREPDPSGLANYRRLIIEKGWSERQLRHELRKSSEFRNRYL